MASGLNTQKRFLVRLSLVTGSTLATIVGAQGLLALDGESPPHRFPRPLPPILSSTPTALRLPPARTY